jgi:hypothetical protein
MIAPRPWTAVAALVLALLLGASPAAFAQVAADDPAPPPAAGPEPLWVPDPEPAAPAPADEEDDPHDVAAVSLPPGDTAPAVAIADDDTRIAVAQWMARAMRDAGLPGELPVMAALVESGLRNLPYGDRDSVGFFQMRLGIWNTGAYEGYLARPELQLRWFADRALAVRDRARAAGNTEFGEDPATWGEWIADIEQPWSGYRGRYATRLAEARALLAVDAPPVEPFALGLTAQPEIIEGAPDVLGRRLLTDPRIELSANARGDVEAGRVDPRLAAVLLQSAEIAPLSVSVFQTGHSYLTVHGTVSNHSFGRAADISFVGGDAVTPQNDAAREMTDAFAALPAEIRPTEIGSPWDIDDVAYFTDSGHQDHLHVGFDVTAGVSQSASPAAVLRITAPKAKARRKPAPAEPSFDARTGDGDRGDEPRFSAGGSR